MARPQNGELDQCDQSISDWFNLGGRKIRMVRGDCRMQLQLRPGCAQRTALARRLAESGFTKDPAEEGSTFRLALRDKLDRTVNYARGVRMVGQLKIVPL